MATSKWKSEFRSVFLTASFGALGWLVTHIVDRIVSTPAVQYKIEHPTIDSNIFSIKLENITRNQHFDDVSLTVRSEKKCGEKNQITDCFTEKKFIAIEPANLGYRPVTFTEVSMSYNIPRMMPGSEYVLSAVYNGTASNKIYINLDSNKSTIRYINKSIETYIVKNEIKILLIILILWGFSLIFLYRSK